MREAATVLIVDDDQELRELLEESLAGFGFRPGSASNGTEMFAELEKHKYDLILLDVMMPGEDGLALCRKLRAPGAWHENIPVIFLTALGDTTDRVVGLELGADDYLAKPFQVRELVARIRALLRRSCISLREERTGQSVKPQEHIWSFGSWKLNILSRHLIEPGGVAVSLSAVEYKLLMLFLERPQEVISREDILRHMANRSPGVDDRGIDVQISRLRSKLHDQSKNPELIRTMRGDGYILSVPVTRNEA